MIESCCNQATKGRQEQVVDKLFSIMQNKFTKQNMKMVIRRFLHVLNKILEADEGKAPQLQFKTQISNKIVEYYISLLTLILKYQFDELILPLKQYRKRWAKRITDEAFYRMKEEAVQRIRFDLDKGFPEDSLRKIRKNYEHRKFTDD